MQKSHYKQLLHERGICVVIPTYNNVNTILDVVKRTLIQCDDVIVVNDGCTDGTAELEDGTSFVMKNRRANLNGTIVELNPESFRNLVQNAYDEYVVSEDVNGKRTVTAAEYYTFAELALIILNVAAVIGELVYKEKQLNTINRIKNIFRKNL